MFINDEDTMHADVDELMMFLPISLLAHRRKNVRLPSHLSSMIGRQEAKAGVY